MGWEGGLRDLLFYLGHRPEAESWIPELGDCVTESPSEYTHHIHTSYHAHTHSSHTCHTHTHTIPHTSHHTTYRHTQHTHNTTHTPFFLVTVTCVLLTETKPHTSYCGRNITSSELLRDSHTVPLMKLPDPGETCCLPGNRPH